MSSGAILRFSPVKAAGLTWFRQVSFAVRSGGIGTATAATPEEVSPKADIVVAGSVAVDLSCDFVDGAKGSSPRMHTSNPASISQSIGGVGHNVALAAHRAFAASTVKLCSIVGDDM